MNIPLFGTLQYPSEIILPKKSIFIKAYYTTVFNISAYSGGISKALPSR
ncbi:hypothetical protein MNB_SV-10-1594 [hydrothermal vent metagenome]|uniref:Uncharacterized protein n=1 Tax=hydrothermal vent metagenome TaxID=652676 RepID=A0A1W1CR06_9ZZZZ